MPEKTILVAITGRVQGVGFRDWTMRQAQGLALRGWVRNEPDGSVSALICGPDETVERMLTLMSSGPAYARVDTVTALPGAPHEVPPDFRQVRSID